MLEKIKAKLEEKFPGLPKLLLGQLANTLAKTVTAEDQIETKITELDTLFPIDTMAANFQREGDRRVTEAQKEWAKKSPKPKPKPDDTDEPDDTDPKPKPKAKVDGDEPPAWAKGLLEKIEKLESDKAQQTIRQQVAAKLKDVPALVWSKRALPESEADIDTFIAEVTSEWTAFKQDANNAALLGEPKPTGSSGPAPDKAEAEIKAWAEAEKAKNKPAESK